MERHHSEGFHGEVELLSPVVRLSLTRNGFNGATRPNGFDLPKWLELGSWKRGPTVELRSTEGDKRAELNGNERKVGNGYRMNGEQIEKEPRVAVFAENAHESGWGK
jgi:hypothetical protein